MKKSAKLIIGVSGASARTKSVLAMMKQIRDEGALPVFLDNNGKNTAASVVKDMARIDALVVMGNNLDIDPKLYIDRYPPGDPKRKIHPQTKSESATPKGKMRARYETQMLEKALMLGMPVLGICGGMQRINVNCRRHAASTYTRSGRLQ